ncbi:MAG TPA: winged helix-turn-helix transcriptional regulator [Roseateles sp.]
MRTDAIPDDVRRFILTAIPSVPYLEAVLQFQRRPHARQSADDIARALYVSPSTANELLEELTAAGILKADGDRFQYAPEAPLAEALDRLAEAYAHNLIGVTELIHDTTRRSAQRFAEAFRLRKRT